MAATRSPPHLRYGRVRDSTAHYRSNVEPISGYKAGVAGIYNRAEHSAERKAALERWAAHVEALVMGPSAKVLAFKGAR